MPDLDYAKVMQRLGLTAGDGPDPDETPDTIWCDGGTVQIEPLNTFVKVADGSPVPWTGGNAVIECTVSDAEYEDATGNGFDGAGYLLFNGKPFVWVVDLSSDKVNPMIESPNATHKITYVGITAEGTPVSFPTVKVRLTAAGDGVSPDGFNDITLLSPVEAGTATPIVRGVQGVGVAGAEIVDGVNLQLELTDGSTVEVGELPVGPGGSDEGVATYLATEDSESRAALDQAAADLLDIPTSALAIKTTASIDQRAPAVVSHPEWVSGTTYAVGDVVRTAQIGELVRCVTANSDVEYTSSKWRPVRTIENGFFRVEQADALPLRSFQAISKGRIGTAGKVPIALRFDDYHNEINTGGLPAEMYSRSLVWSLASISRQDVQAWFTSAVTGWNTILGWCRNGMEIWSHGIDHQSPYDADPEQWYAKMYEQVVDSRRRLEYLGFRVQGWAMPGVPAPGYGSFLTSDADWKSDIGRLLTAYYPLVETDAIAPYRELPSDARVGLCHITISDTAYTLAQLQQFAEKAIRTGTGVEFMTHFGLVGASGKLPTATFWQFIDWLVAQRDAGRIEIVTPSSLPYCDVRSTTRPDLLGDPNFTSTSTDLAVHEVWQGIDGVNNARAFVNDGPNGRGADVLRINTPSGSPVYQTPHAMQQRNLNGTTLMAVMQARRVGATGTLRITQESLLPYALGVQTRDVALSTSWTTVRMPYTPHISTNTGSFGLTTTAGVVEVTDCHLYVA